MEHNTGRLVERSLAFLLNNQRLQTVKNQLERLGGGNLTSKTFYGYVLGGMYSAIMNNEQVDDPIFSLHINCEVNYYNNWEQQIERAAAAAIVAINQNIGRFPLKKCNVKIKFYLKPSRLVMGNDVDNLAKTVLDALKHAGVYVDDSWVMSLHVSKHPISNSFVEGVDISVSEADEENF